MTSTRMSRGAPVAVEIDPPARHVDLPRSSGRRAPHLCRPSPASPSSASTISSSRRVLHQVHHGLPGPPASGSGSRAAVCGKYVPGGGSGTAAGTASQTPCSSSALSRVLHPASGAARPTCAGATGHLHLAGSRPPSAAPPRRRQEERAAGGHRSSHVVRPRHDLPRNPCRTQDAAHENGFGEISLEDSSS